jgi:hypothetical protein
MRTNNPWTRDDGVHGVGVVFQGFERQRQVILQRIKAVEDAVMKELLSKPALVSALFKKSFSTANWPILACSGTRSKGSSAPTVPPKTLAALSRSCFFHSLVWLGCSSNCLHSAAL